MHSDELRALQAPLKERYREDPESAIVTLKAEGRLGENLACSVDTGRALVEAGLHPATGGSGSQACSGDMLLQALAACAGVTLQAVATAFGVTLRSGRVLAEGDLDFRGTLGLAKDASVGFREIRMRFELDADADEETLDKVAAVTERYCVVLQTLRSAPPVVVSRGAMDR
ncbi:OsmC family protein [Thiorhodococcus drewsii AZ1]|uniref:OsmC family protein n=2 Tax=Thiorhodococcus drewsii TaxID=210408 RepID=G2E5U7_9GAMM|nr:OsmC family protein [Thiorhodococcus drewsii AZ1]